MDVYDKNKVPGIIKKILNYDLQKTGFYYLKEELYRNIEFYKSSNPTHQALNWLFRLGFKFDINYFEMTNLIKSIKLNDFIKFKKEFFKSIYIKSFAIGTINKEETEKRLNLLIQTIFDFNKEALKTTFEKDNDKLQMFVNLKSSALSMNMDNFIFQKHNFYKNSLDASTLNVFFLGENNLENFINMRIVGKIAGNIFFSRLRIKEQLGYSIKNKLLNVENNLVKIT